MEWDKSTIAKLIDHTMLKADASGREIEALCQEATEYGFCSVCVNPFNVEQAVRLLKKGSVKVGTVIGFPLGATSTAAKVFESNDALAKGAKELDMVINIGAVKNNDFGIIEREISEIRKISKGFVLKVIIETCYLKDEEKIRLCRIAAESGADFVKTSTGFGTMGATTEDVRMMRETVGAAVGVKASGGIRDLETLKKMVMAGANRIGTSSGVKIIKELEMNL
ncbi:MAG: Deoxyribose-phosphate aldolase [Firmicutes bacterium]|nr:Deoxyribose-phosphate aldolase [Bacillota bacterium]MDI6706874.1 deoxyribose-phosphate aldolase [Bacillota bacterium]